MNKCINTWFPPQQHLVECLLFPQIQGGNPIQQTVHRLVEANEGDGEDLIFHVMLQSIHIWPIKKWSIHVDWNKFLLSEETLTTVCREASSQKKKLAGGSTSGGLTCRFKWDTNKPAAVQSCWVRKFKWCRLRYLRVRHNREVVMNCLHRARFGLEWIINQYVLMTTVKLKWNHRTQRSKK